MWQDRLEKTGCMSAVTVVEADDLVSVMDDPEWDNLGGDNCHQRIEELQGQGLRSCLRHPETLPTRYKAWDAVRAGIYRAHAASAAATHRRPQSRWQWFRWRPRAAWDPPSPRPPPRHWCGRAVGSGAASHRRRARCRGGPVATPPPRWPGSLCRISVQRSRLKATKRNRISGHRSTISSRSELLPPPAGACTTRSFGAWVSLRKPSQRGRRATVRADRPQGWRRAATAWGAARRGQWFWAARGGDEAASAACR